MLDASHRRRGLLRSVVDACGTSFGLEFGFVELGLSGLRWIFAQPPTPSPSFAAGLALMPPRKILEEKNWNAGCSRFEISFRILPANAYNGMTLDNMFQMLRSTPSDTHERCDRLKERFSLATRAYHGPAMMRGPDDERWYDNATLTNTGQHGGTLMPGMVEETSATYESHSEPCGDLL